MNASGNNYPQQIFEGPIVQGCVIAALFYVPFHTISKETMQKDIRFLQVPVYYFQICSNIYQGTGLHIVKPADAFIRVGDHIRYLPMDDIS